MSTKHAVRFVLAVAFCLLPVLRGRASRREVPFDQAMERAAIVVQGEILDARDAFPPDAAGHRAHERVYRLKVEKCFKGNMADGQEIVFWDRHHGTTAAYLVWERGRYVCFLEPDELSAYEQQHLDPEGKGVLKPVRIRSEHRDSYRQELQLLDLFVEHPPADKRAAYRALLESGKDPHVLHYVIRDWPTPLLPDDVILFKNVLVNADEYTALHDQILGILLKQSVTFSDQQVLALLEKGGPSRLGSLRTLIHSDNVARIQEWLFSWIMDARDSGGTVTYAIELLSSMTPDYFRQQLAAHELPFWKLIPCLAALGINGSDIGREDFSPELMQLRVSHLYQVSQFLGGDTFWAWGVISDPGRHPEWKTALPVLEPMLQKSDSPVRRLAVALFRTFGVPVKRSGEGYAADLEADPVPCPVRLELLATKPQVAIGQPVKLILTECAVRDGAVISHEGEVSFSIECLNQWTSPGRPNPNTWAKVDLPVEQFVVLKPGMERISELEIPARRMSRPGTYRISALKCYPHDGLCAGLDAWTGVVFSQNEITIDVVSDAEDAVTRTE